MATFPSYYKEVIPDQTLPEKWKEFTLNTGGTRSTLQDIKVPQRAGGYCYKDQSQPHSRNRFIYWRIYDDILELVEHSLDVNLVGNQVRYRFHDSPVLEGLTIHETSQAVVVLVCTVSSVHRFTFPLPNRINKQEYGYNQLSEYTMQSIFAEASLSAAKDPTTFHVINSSTANTLMPNSSTSWVCPNNEALFALAYTNGTILLTRHDPNNGTVATFELRQESLTSRLFSGLTGAIRGRSNEENVAESMVLHSFGPETYLFCLGRSGQLRVWSCSKAQCILVSDVLDEVIDHSKNITQGAQSHVLRKAVTTGANDSELLLGVFLCFATECQFVVVQLVHHFNNLRFSRLFDIRAPQGQDLVDFALCQTQLWAVWRNTQGDTAVSTVDICSTNYASDSTSTENEADCRWVLTELESGPDREHVLTDAMTDPRQAYFSYIFHPGRFSLQVIVKALSIFHSYDAPSRITLADLKEDVTRSVEHEIQSEVSDYELIDEEYLEVANRCWAKFYSCCVQYHVSGSRPIGLVLLTPNGGLIDGMLSATSGVALVKKSYVSLLRPMEPLETLMNADPSHLSCSQVMNFSGEILADVANLMQVLNILEQSISEEIKTDIEKQLYRLSSPELVLQQLAKEILSDVAADEGMGLNLMVELEKKLRFVRDLPAAMKVLLETLNVTQVEFQSQGDVSRHHQLLVNQLFSSHMGISTISEVTRQIAIMRYSLCRNLLLLQQLLLQPSRELYSAEVKHIIGTLLVSRTVICTHAYFVVMWISQTPATPVLKPNILESSMQRMAILKLSDMSGAAAATASALGSGRALRSYTLLELFLQAVGVSQVQRLLAEQGPNADGLSHWNASMLPFVSTLIQLIWPISENFVFPEFLLSSCQHLLIQEYTRLLNNWCEANVCSRKFLLGSAFLDMGEPHKALDLLIAAAKGISTESFLGTKIVPVTDESSEDRLHVIYYLKVIQLFEQQNCPDCVIELAGEAIGMAEREDPDLPTLHSVAFVNHLRLEHPEQAYQSLNANPDSARRVDCLRQFVVTLLDRRRFDLLLEFPYESLSQDLERIVESRARSLDISNPAFYNFLYAFHIKKGNMRKAASVMYEQGMRLGLEGSHTAELTERQAKCYLACLNSLQLVEPKFAWIVKPSLAIVPSGPKEDSDVISASPKRSIDGKEIEPSKWKRRVEVLEVCDIRKEYEVIQCRLRLIRHSPEKYKRTGCRLAPGELVAVLCQVGMYQAAIKLCRSHKLRSQIVLESLASACVRLSTIENSGRETSSAWEWLGENDLSDLGVGEGNVVSLAWRLMEVTLLSCEEEKQTVLHKAVTNRLLSLGIFLPNWLVVSYKQRNPSEMLRVLLGAGRLIEAGELAIEYLGAALGLGKERFGFLTALHSTTPAVCLPIPTIELLLLELNEVSSDNPDYGKINDDLQSVYHKYLEAARQVSVKMEQTAILIKTK